MNVFFRADGSRDIGIGHIMRCLALAGGLKKSGFEVAFISRPYEEPIITKIRLAGYSVFSIPIRCSIEEDLERTIALVQQSNKSPILIIDCYRLEEAYQRAVKKGGFPLMTIDDLAQEHFWADLVLNQNIYAREELYSTEPYTRLLLGPRYALLRDEFALWRGRSKSPRERAKHILVTLGGADPDNQTLKVVKALSLLKKEGIETLVVIGPSYPHSDALTGYIDGRRSRFILRKAVDSVVELMDWADLAVSGGGSTCWELACLGVPNLILALSDNQKQNGQELARAGVSVYLGWWENVSTEAIAETLQQIIEDGEARRKMSQAGQALVDGHGVYRVAETIREL